jgi:hypothetical protein
MPIVLCECCNELTNRCAYCNSDVFVDCDCPECLACPVDSRGEKCADCGEENYG